MTTEDWKKRIAPHLSSSLQTVSERITQTEVVQSWLQSASMKAAEGLGNMSGVQGEMQGYMRMLDDLKERLPNLLEAVDEMTEGCGQVDLHWRPLQPNFSRLYITFDRNYSVKVFCRLSECTKKEVRAIIDSVADALPAGDPFPNRPNVVTGLAARDGMAVGVRVKDALRDDGDGTMRRITLLPPEGKALEDRSQEDATRDLLRLLCSD